MSEQPSNFDITNTAQQGQDDLLAALVGEGKKFKTVADLAKGKVEADTFIDKLQTENKALREALDSDGNPDEVLKRINELLQAKDGSHKNATNQNGNQSTKESLSEEKVLELLNKREREQKIKENITSFNQTINKAFGNKTGEVIATRLSELGMEQEHFSNLAATNPQAALRILGLKEGSAVSTGGGLDSSVDTEAYFGPAGKGNDETRNFKYFTDLRRKLGMAYYEPHIQKEVFEQRKKLGPAFWK